MEAIMKQVVEWKKLELVIDTNIFAKDIVLKAAYNFLDKGYFLFQMTSEWNILLQLSLRNESKEKLEDVLALFSDELLDVYLRDKLERDNKVIRETIVTKAIAWPLDVENFVSLDTETNAQQNQIDFDKDIDDILKEIENDPDLKIDEEEIEAILKEIEEETQSELEKPKITVDTGAISGAKDMFKNKKK